MPERTIAVVGANGFVGGALLEEFAARGVCVTAVVRRSTAVTRAAEAHEVLSVQESQGRRFDVVVNLAYPTSAPSFQFAAADNAIRDTIGGLVEDGGHVIHVSSLAVFGLQLQREPRLGAAPIARDHPYIESKARMEAELVKMWGRRRFGLDIVRLGNVWGRASPSWVVPLVQRLITGRPVGIHGVRSRSNTTDVFNVSSYLAFLAQHADRRDGVRYHHLAEFSEIPWSHWVAALAEKLQCDPVLADSQVLQKRDGVRGELAEALRPLQPRSLYRRFMREDVVGSFLRSGLRRVPLSVTGRLRGQSLVHAPAPTLSSPDEFGFLSVLATTREFRTAVDDQWTPPLSSDASLQRVVEWLD